MSTEEGDKVVILYVVRRVIEKGIPSTEIGSLQIEQMLSET
jgi:hypothetical protein